MTTKVTNTGNNSVMIEYESGTSSLDVLQEVKTFLENHGWTAVETDFFNDGNEENVRTYEAANKNSTYKYAQVGYDSGVPGFFCKVGENYSGGFERIATDSDNTTYYLGCNLSSEHGRLHVFATNRYMALFHLGNTHIGCNYGGGLIGCFELEISDDQDSSPAFCWCNTVKLAEGDQCISPIRTIRWTGAEAANSVRIITPIGSWGRIDEDQNMDQSKVVPEDALPFGDTIQHHVYNMTVSVNKWRFRYRDHRYVKGRLFGLKVFTTGGGGNGDVFSAKCDSDMLLDRNGTDTNHFIVHMNYSDGTNKGTVGIPL